MNCDSTNAVRIVKRATSAEISGRFQLRQNSMPSRFCVVENSSIAAYTSAANIVVSANERRAILNTNRKILRCVASVCNFRRLTVSRSTSDRFDLAVVCIVKLNWKNERSENVIAGDLLDCVCPSVF